MAIRFTFKVEDSDFDSDSDSESDSDSDCNFEFPFFLLSELSVTSQETELNGRFLVHAVQLEPHSSFKEHEFCQFFTLSPLAEKTLNFAVQVKFNKAFGL